jgi:hypothetical protein
MWTKFGDVGEQYRDRLPISQMAPVPEIWVIRVATD